ncbi:hypothetical protein CEXT_778041 [Caerostris extrusa]|uniref:Uncharacterized protein n=1 Tax=Caerostris extrusa TaxID=172846 RepID=A0AAV4RAC8_CAEEX|nr:hypothetical protein CEXT_778041 [Caerostris extrusa]
MTVNLTVMSFFSRNERASVLEHETLSDSRINRSKENDPCHLGFSLRDIILSSGAFCGFEAHIGSLRYKIEKFRIYPQKKCVVCLFVTKITVKVESCVCP